jgi:hypothetical protein
MMVDLGTDYIRNRAREVRLLRSQARVQLGHAEHELVRARVCGTSRDVAAARNTLVACLSNVFTADAMLEALEGR